MTADKTVQEKIEPGSITHAIKLMAELSTGSFLASIE